MMTTVKLTNSEQEDTMVYTVKSMDDINALKRNWMGDPCWDIEETEGFEVYADELRQFRLEREAEQRGRETLRVELKTAELGINAALLRYIERLERRIALMEVELSKSNS